MELLRPSSVDELDGGVLVHGGTEVVPLLREGLLTADSLVDLAGLVPSGIDGSRIGAATSTHSQLIPSRRVERYGVQVNDAVVRLEGVLQRHPLAQRAQIVSEVERRRCRLDTRQHSWHPGVRARHSSRF